ncbi:MAG: siderophore-interacting protein [Rhizobiaceae bacterium]|nr:siderophore-interacting protein [Rhizobiaceae bacterium]
MTIATFAASGIAIQDNAARILDQLCDHLGEHVAVTKTAGRANLKTVIGDVDIALSPRRMDIDIRCPSSAALFTIRSMVAEHLFLFSGEEPLDLSWADGSQSGKVPNFREVTVVRAHNITPHMRRVTVATEDAAHFSHGGLHVRLLIPPKGRTPVWPQTAADGRIQWPKGDDELVIRAYTIRNIDLGRGEMDIDFVVHDGDEVPGASWALNAQPGDRAGLMGPGGGDVPAAKNMVLAGDETALPAIARIAAAMPADATLRIFLEVDGKDEEQPLPSRAAQEITWLHRNGQPAGSTGILEKTLRDVVTKGDRSAYVWAACEQSEARAIRNFMKTESGYDRDHFSIAAYWQR